MRNIIRCILVIIFLSTATNISAQEKKFEFGGYGEILYQHFDYGPNQRLLPTGSKEDSRAIIDIPRFVLSMEYKFTKDIYIESEVEFEHLGTGSSMELEYEEFGEFEFESEKGGEVLLEELHLTKKFSESFNLRVGRMIVPVGLLNKSHKPDNYFTTIRTESVSKIIPAVWNETGIQAFGSFEDFNYRVLIINGLQSGGFSSENWIAEGHQSTFELVNATSMAFAGRIGYNGINNLELAADAYFGETNKNRYKPNDLSGVSGNLFIYSLHGIFQSENVTVRGSYVSGTLENSDKISAANARMSTNTQAARTPVAKSAAAWYLETGYNVLSLMNTDNYKLYPFVKYEYYNSMEDVVPGMFADPRFRRNIITVGANFFLTPKIVLKLDYAMRKVGGFDSAYNDENTIGFSIGFADKFSI